MAKETITNKEQTLAEALEKIETLSATNEKLTQELEAKNTAFANVESEFLQAKAELEKLQKTNRDIDEEVAVKVAQVASQSGVEALESTQNAQEEESIEDLAKRIENAKGVEKAKLIEANEARIMKALKGA